MSVSFQFRLRKYFYSHQSKHETPIIPPVFRRGNFPGNKTQSYRKGCGDHQRNSGAVKVWCSALMVGFSCHLHSESKLLNISRSLREALLVVRMHDESWMTRAGLGDMGMAHTWALIPTVPLVRLQLMRAISSICNGCTDVSHQVTVREQARRSVHAIIPIPVSTALLDCVKYSSLLLSLQKQGLEIEVFAGEAAG